jgi:amino acid permease
MYREERMKSEERTTVANVIGAWIVLAVAACAVIGLMGFVVFEEASQTYFKLFYGGAGTLLILTGAHFSMLTVNRLLSSLGTTVYLAGGSPRSDEEDLEG